MTTIQVFERSAVGARAPLCSIWIGIDDRTRTILGGVTLADGSAPIRVRVDLAAIEKRIWAALRAQNHGIGFLGKAINKVKRTVSKAAKAVGVAKVIGEATKVAKKVAKGAKKVFEHPAFGAAIGITSVILAPVGGAGLAAGYALARMALRLADGAAKKHPAAQAEIKKLADAGPEGRKVLDMVATFRSAPALEVALSNNPWRTQFAR